MSVDRVRDFYERHKTAASLSLAALSLAAALSERAIPAAAFSRSLNTTNSVNARLVTDVGLNSSRCNQLKDKGADNDERSNWGNTYLDRIIKECKEEKPKKKRAEAPQSKPKSPIDVAIEACEAEQNRLYTEPTLYDPHGVIVKFKEQVIEKTALGILREESVIPSSTQLLFGLGILTGNAQGPLSSTICKLQIRHPADVVYAERELIFRPT